MTVMIPFDQSTNLEVFQKYMTGGKKKVKDSKGGKSIAEETGWRSVKKGRKSR